jgi:regulator of sigma D
LKHSTDTLVHHWHKQRTHLLKTYHNLASLFISGDISLHDHVSIDNLEMRLKHFCETLIDYYSLSHFKLFEKLSEVITLPTAIFEKIVNTTQLGVHFSDQYTNHTPHETPAQLGRLKRFLSHVGEALTQRFDLEDQLTCSYFSKNCNLSATSFQ